MEEFLGLYAKVTKEDIRKNNIAEALGFLKRIVHGTNARARKKEIEVTLGEPTTPSQVMES